MHLRSLPTIDSDPKLATRTFQMFRCVDLGPRIGTLLEADFSKTCFKGVHAEYVPVAVGSAGHTSPRLPRGWSAARGGLVH